MAPPWPANAEPATIGVAGTGASTLTWTVPNGVLVRLESVYAELDTSAGSGTPLMTIADQSGVVIAKKRQGEAVDDAGTSSATWALRLDDSQAASGSGITFDTDNQGGYLAVQTNACVDLDTLPDPAAVGGTWGTVFEDDSGCGTLLAVNLEELLLKSRGGPVDILSDGAGGLGNAAVNVTANVGDVLVQSVAAAFAVSTGVTIQSDHNQVVIGSGSGEVGDNAGVTIAAGGTGTVIVSLLPTGSLEISLAAGQAFTVLNSANAPIFRVDEDGDLHGKTGKSLVFDL